MRIISGWLLISASGLFCQDAYAQTTSTSTLEPQALFSSGVLSPDYPSHHSASSGHSLQIVGKEKPSVGILFNPGQALFSIWTLHFEFAPFRYISFPIETTVLWNTKLPNLDKPVTLSGAALAAGLYLWPSGESMRGWYLGPRYSAGIGGTRYQGTSSIWYLSSWGADLGYQWVSGVFALNLGVGLSRATIRTESNVQYDTAPGEQFSIPTINKAFLLPSLSIAIGVAF